jgi:hypothetical protein
MPTVARCDLADVDPTTLPSTYLLPRDDRTLLPSWLARVARERLGVEPVELAGGATPTPPRPAGWPTSSPRWALEPRSDNAVTSPRRTAGAALRSHGVTPSDPATGC